MPWSYKINIWNVGVLVNSDTPFYILVWLLIASHLELVREQTAVYGY